jgi:hypothetical protein
VITLLLDRRGDDVKIIDEVIKAAVGNERSGREGAVPGAPRRVGRREDPIVSAVQRAAVLTVTNEIPSRYGPCSKLCGGR